MQLSNVVNSNLIKVLIFVTCVGSNAKSKKKIQRSTKYAVPKPQAIRVRYTATACAVHIQDEIHDST